jgi:hypothetical protein
VFRTLVKRIPPEHAYQILLEAIGGTDSTSQSTSPKRVPPDWLAGLAETVSAEDAASGLKAIVVVSGRTPDALSNFIPTLQVLAHKCRPEDAAQFVEPLVLALERLEAPAARMGLADALLSLHAALPESAIARVLRHTLLSLPASSDRGAARAPINLIQKIASRLSEPQAIELFNVWLTGAQKFEPELFETTADALIVLAGRVHPMAARAAATNIAELMAQSLEPRRTKDLSRILTALLSRVPDTEGIAVGVEVLKGPTAVGQTEQVLIDFFQKLAGERNRFDGSLWSAIDWITKTYPSTRVDDPALAPESLVRSRSTSTNATIARQGRRLPKTFWHPFTRMGARPQSSSPHERHQVCHHRHEQDIGVER